MKSHVPEIYKCQWRFDFTQCQLPKRKMNQGETHMEIFLLFLLVCNVSEFHKSKLLFFPIWQNNKSLQMLFVLHYYKLGTRKNKQTNIRSLVNFSGQF